MEGEPSQHSVHVGQRTAWGGDQPLLLSAADRHQHLYVLGKTGTGKSTLLRNLILQDIAAGEGIGLIDPHGDLATDILDHIPRGRTDDVVYFDPAADNAIIGLNLIQATPASRQ